MDLWKWHGGAPAAIKTEIHALVFVVNDAHLAIATHMVDMHPAIEMQDNAGIQRKHGAAHRGSDHGSDDGDDGDDDGLPNRKRRRNDDAWHRVRRKRLRHGFCEETQWRM